MLEQNETTEHTREVVESISEEHMEGLRILARMLGRKILEERKRGQQQQPKGDAGQKIGRA